MKKILFVSHGGRRRGGAQNVLFDMMQFARAQFEVECALPEAGAFQEEIAATGIPTHVIDPSPGWCFQPDTVHHVVQSLSGMRPSMDRWTELMRARQPNLVVTNTITRPEAALSAYWLHVPHVWVIQELLSSDPALTCWLRFEALYPTVTFLSRAVICASQAVYDELAPWVRSDAGKLRVIHLWRFGDYPGVEPGPRAREPMVLSVGGVARRKGQLTMLKAMRRIVDQEPKAHLLIAGKMFEHEYKNAVLTERSALGLDGNVSLLKWVPDMPTLYRKCAVLLHAATSEPLGISVLEAMAHGLPVVTTDTGGPAELVVEGETGYRVPVGDDGTMAKRVLKLLRDPELADRMGRASYERAISTFSPAACQANILSIFSEVSA